MEIRPESVMRLAIGAFVLACALPVQAQTDATRVGALEEVIVTAQKREQSLQQVPAAVSAITSSDLDKPTMTNLQDIKALVPNMYMEEALSAATTPKLFMRGVGVDNQVFSFDTPIGIYVDGVYYARVTGALVDLFDIERIEVLRGPQSVLYGRNNSVGTIRVITRDPVLEGMELTGSVGYGSKDQTNFGGTVSIPLVANTLGMRLSASRRTNDGWMKNLSTGERFQNDDIVAFRGSLLYQANDDWRIYLRGDYMLDESDPRQGSNFLVNPDDDIYTFESSPGVRFVNEVEPWGTSLDIAGSFGDVDVHSITAYRELRYRNANDVDGRSDVRSFEVDQQDLDEDQFTQEVYFSGDRLGSLDIDWVAGAFYFQEDNLFQWALRIFAPPTTQVFDQDTESTAGYIHGSLPVTDRMRLSGGLRYTDESKKMTAIQFLPDGTLNTGFNFSDEITASEWTWQAAADYDLNDDTLLYVRGGTGFRSGGFNGSARDIPSIETGGFDIEEALSVEGGVKSDLFDGQLRLNTAYFWVEYTGLQFAVTQSDGTITTTNVEATVHGLEVEARAAPVEGLEITGTIGTMNDDIKNSDLELKNSPTFTGNLGMNYTFPFRPDGGSFTLGGDVTYRTDSFNDTNNGPFTNTGDYEIVNAFVRYETPGKHWALTLAGLNLTDQFVNIHTFNIAGGFISSVHFPNTPRRWLLTLRYTM